MAYSFDLKLLQERVRTFIEIYNTTVDRKRRHESNDPVENFIDANAPRIKWTHRVKASLKKLELSNYEEFALFARRYIVHSLRNISTSITSGMKGVINSIGFSLHRETEAENRVIIVPSVGRRADYWCYCTNIIPNLTLTSIDGNQSFPFYTYNEDGTKPPRKHHRLGVGTIPRPLSGRHHRKVGHLPLRLRPPPPPPTIGSGNQANLKRDLPRLPYTPDFWAFATAGQRLGGNSRQLRRSRRISAPFHRNPRYPAFNWRVEKMKLSRDSTQLIYNEFLTLDGIPTKALDYRLGNRSALEWIIDQVSRQNGQPQRHR